jgi:3-deoxy-D-manno-octulosonate 8-phosphate phosphatase (KDO 8-P phosphatase)
MAVAPMRNVFDLTAKMVAPIRLLGVDIDGTLTDGFVYWAGPEVGWTMRFAVRDGEAILRAVQAGLVVVPISRNRTLCARTRMEALKLPLTWVGVSDKMAALDAVCEQYNVGRHEVAYVGDGHEDAPILQAVGLGCAPSDGHADARAASHYVTTAPGGRAAVEEVIERILAHRPAPA